MNENKYRAWDKLEKRMRDVLCIEFGHTPSIVLVDYSGGYDVQTDLRDWCDVILMQYTGLEDKNKKEIYEGDIISYKHSLYKNEAVTCVEYDDEYCGYLPFIYSIYPDYYRIIDIEVIGNIFENPELLEV